MGHSVYGHWSSLPWLGLGSANYMDRVVGCLESVREPPEFLGLLVMLVPFSNLRISITNI